MWIKRPKNLPVKTQAKPEKVRFLPPRFIIGNYKMSTVIRTVNMPVQIQFESNSESDLDSEKINNLLNLINIQITQVVYVSGDNISLGDPNTKML